VAKLNNRQRGLEPSAIQLIEEAVQLLRATPASTWVIYYAAAAPWVLGFLAFWGYATWFAPGDVEIATLSLGLVLLFIALKFGQTVFSGRLLAQCVGDAPPKLTWRDARRVLASQTFVQGWGLVALPISAVASVPFGWVCAFYQSATVIELEKGRSGSVFDVALEEAKRWPKQNHLALLYVSVIALAAWANIAFAFYLVPMLANRLLGIENVFGLKGWFVLNSTFLASVTALTWLAVDPLLKAVYVLRVFYGRSQRTGADLSVALKQATRSSTRTAGTSSRAALVVLAFCLLVASPSDASAVETAAAKTAPAPTSQKIEPGQLNESIERVLRRRDFEWQLRPELRPLSKEDDNVFRRFLKHTLDVLGGMLRWIGRSFAEIIDWFSDLFPKPTHAKGGASGLAAASWLKILLYVLIGAAVLLIARIVYLMIVGGRRVSRPAVLAAAAAPALPDLEDEHLEAAQLPSDEWIALAREQMAKGDWRLALRALYLATLARLANEGLLTLAKFKTNLDYERELRRRAASNTTLLESFSARRRTFESVWYGRVEADEQGVRRWLNEFLGGGATP
jgi:hypothetical protein